jgi:hypothetical protein
MTIRHVDYAGRGGRSGRVAEAVIGKDDDVAACDAGGRWGMQRSPLSLAMRMYTPVAGWKSSPVAKSGISGGQSNVHALT